MTFPPIRTHHKPVWNITHSIALFWPYTDFCLKGLPFFFVKSVHLQENVPVGAKIILLKNPLLENVPVGAEIILVKNSYHYQCVQAWNIPLFCLYLGLKLSFQKEKDQTNKYSFSLELSHLFDHCQTDRTHVGINKKYKQNKMINL